MRASTSGAYRVTDVVAFALWALALALFLVAASVGPRYQCDDDTRAAYVIAAHRSALALAGVALALLASAGLLLGGGIGSRGGARVVRLVGAAISFLLAAIIGIVALFNAVELGCLE
jgi:hypothetical protein